MEKNKTYPRPYSRHHKTAARRPLTGGFLLYLFAAILLIALLKSLNSGQPISFLAGAISFVSMLAGAWCVRKGLFYEAEAAMRKWNRSTRVPWKVTGSILVAVSTAVASLFMVGQPLIIAVGAGIGALVGCLLSYGLDPQYSNPDAVSTLGVTTDEVVEALKEAEAKIVNIENAAKSIHEFELKDRLRRITGKAREILDVIEEDPRDLRRARKFMKVYLEGAEKVTQGYVKMHPGAQDAKLEDNFRNVLKTIEDVFTEQHQKLMENDVLDLDIQIEVLQAQLKHEGVI